MYYYLIKTKLLKFLVEDSYLLIFIVKLCFIFSFSINLDLIYFIKELFSLLDLISSSYFL